ncbi:MAG: hypothetical protein EP346_01960 [Bacteroidetes bacterium]|nr:MAG: hypothetical protein EP346_01960 [Bacteroidota bacterium]
MRNIAQGVILALIISTAATGQSYNDVVRYSRQADYGSARYMALGGAFSALGNDFSAAAMNPAGLAVYRHDELSFSTNYRNTLTETGHYGKSTEGLDGRFSFHQFGIVLVTDLEDDARFNFGIRYNRTNDYGFEQQINATNTDGSIVDQWFDNADFYSPNSADLWGAGLIFEQLAADVELIGFNSGTSSWEQYAWGTDVLQKESFISHGGRGEFALDFAYEKDNEWHFGGSIVIPTILYQSREIYSESNFDPASSFRSFTMKDNNDIRGTGIQINAGVLWTPENFGRVSAYIHSPTFWSFAQSGSLEFTSYDKTGGGSLNSYQPFDDFLWRMQTPMVFGAGYAYVFEKFGLISVDYSYQDMTTARVSARRYPGELDYLNEDIDNQLKGVQDIRVGGELRLDKMFLRGGYHYTSTPFKTSEPVAYQYSLGWGYKANQWGVDLTYSRKVRSDSFYLYSDLYTQPTSRTITDNIFVATVYFRL